MQDSSIVQEQPTTPRYVQVANLCGITAVVLICLFVFYATLAALTTGLPAPSTAVANVWNLIAVILAVVKIGQWSSDRATARVVTAMDRRFAAIMDETGRVSNEALQRTNEAGRWQGTAETLHDRNLNDTSEFPSVPSITGGRRGGVRS